VYRAQSTGDVQRIRPISARCPVSSRSPVSSRHGSARSYPQFTSRRSGRTPNSPILGNRRRGSSPGRRSGPRRFLRDRNEKSLRPPAGPRSSASRAAVGLSTTVYRQRCRTAGCSYNISYLQPQTRCGSSHNHCTVLESQPDVLSRKSFENEQARSQGGSELSDDPHGAKKSTFPPAIRAVTS